MLTSAWPRPSVIDDDRALETDIMRFMAILGFCLMAVFALIQSIPISQQTGGVGLQTQARLEQQLNQMQDQVRSLLSKVANLQAQLEVLEQANTMWEIERQALTQQLAKSEQQLLEQLVTAAQLMQALQSEQQVLVSLQSEVRGLQREAYREQLKLESAERALAQLSQARPAKAPQASPPAPKTLTKPVRKTKPVAPAASAQPPGLTMRYASTAAIERLIAGGRTVLYGVSGQRAWRSTPQGDFVPTPKPNRPYELTETPGQRLMQKFRRSSGLLSASDVQWWVTFDAGIVSQITRHLDTQRSGQLVIQANGQVLHQPAAVAALSE